MQLHARNRIESSAQSRARCKCPTSSAKYLWLLEVICGRLLQRKLLQTVLPVILSGGFSEVILAFEKSYYSYSVKGEGIMIGVWLLGSYMLKITSTETTPDTGACQWLLGMLLSQKPHLTPMPVIPLSFPCHSVVAAVWLGGSSSGAGW